MKCQTEGPYIAWKNGLLYAVISSTCRSSSLALTHHRPLHGINLCIKHSATYPVLTRSIGGHLVGHSRTANHHPVIVATVLHSVRSSTHHGRYGIIRVAGQCESTRSIVDWVQTSRVLNGAEVPLRSNTDTVVLIGQLSSSRGIVVEASNSPIDCGMVLQTAGICPGHTRAFDLCDSDSPQAIECRPTGDHCQCNWITQSHSCIDVH